MSVRDLLSAASALVTLFGGALYAIAWREILASRKQGHRHANWLTDHEGWNMLQGKPPYDPKD